MSLRLGSVCTGYGGLDLAVAQVLDVEHAWVADVCKFDADGNAGHHEPHRAPCTILAHHFPGVPNLGDIKAIDWSAVPSIDVFCAGYPCQPFSHAGRRRGTDDPRHLWPFIREAIRVLRPRLTFLENVDGHRSLGFDRVVGDMAEDGMHVRWVVLPASGVGAPHRRNRLFIAITPDAEREGWGAEGDAAATDTLSRALTDAPASLLPTPRTENNENRQSEGFGGGKDGNFHELVNDLSRWGKYAAAIARWEAITRPAPEPTNVTDGYLKARAKRLARQDKRPVGMRGSLKVRRQLAARFSEWMMGVPLGWITGVPGITRSEALKAAGNGVVPQQAAEALRFLLDMPTGRQIAAAAEPDDLLELLAVGE